MTVAGIMSGTSADGIDVAVVRIAPGKKIGGIARPSIELIAHEGFAFPAALRRAVLAAMNAQATSTAELARLNWRLGIAYAEAVKATLTKHKMKVDLIGCHGQTIYHQPRVEMYAGRKFACTWQVGEAQVIAAELGIPVASNFRPADMVVGGQGAPLVPLLDYVMFADAKRGRVLQNIGGIGNLTAIPAGASAENVVAFDTGPGNMVMDWLTQELFGKRYDKNGALAAAGNVIEPVLKAALRNPYFKLKPPRTAGREQFGREYAAEFLKSCRSFSERNEDALATATALTAETIAGSYERFVAARMNPIASGAKARTDSSKTAYGLKPVPFNVMRAAKRSGVDFVVSGGGARNGTLMRMLAARLEPLGCEMAASEEFGLPVEAKEAAAFALLAWMTWHRLPGNMPAATGAKRGVVLGQIAYV